MRCCSRCASSSLFCAAAREPLRPARRGSCRAPLEPRLGRDEVLGRVERQAVHRPHHLAGHRIDRRDARHDIVVQLEADDHVVVRRMHLDHVAAHAEAAAPDFESLRGYWIATSCSSSSRAREPRAGARVDAHAAPVLGRAEAVDARHARHDDDVVALEQHRRGLQPQPVDVVVDARVLGDVRVGGRHVGFGLVVVVVGDEVADRVVREELPELAVELGRQRLVVRDHQRRAVPARDRRSRP